MTILAETLLITLSEIEILFNFRFYIRDAIRLKNCGFCYDFLLTLAPASTQLNLARAVG